MRRLPDNIIKELNLKKGQHIGMSFAMDLIIYERGDLKISNYNFTISEPEKYDPDLSKKNIWLVFCKKHNYAKWFMATDEFITDATHAFKAEVADLENEILSKFN
jgi:hypothetical protein